MTERPERRQKVGQLLLLRAYQACETFPYPDHTFTFCLNNSLFIHKLLGSSSRRNLTYPPHKGYRMIWRSFLQFLPAQ